MASMQQKAAEAALKNKHVQAAAKKEAEKQARAKLGEMGIKEEDEEKKEDPKKKEKRGSVFGFMSKTVKDAGDAVAGAAKSAKDAVKRGVRTYKSQARGSTPSPRRASRRSRFVRRAVREMDAVSTTCP